MIAERASDWYGKTDIPFGDGDTWRFSPDGSKPLTRLRRADGTERPLRQLLVGNFDGEPRATLVGYGVHDRNSFGIWRGLGSQNSFVGLSEQKMR